MSTFKSYRSYEHFSRSVKNEFRFIHTEESIDFLNCLLKTSTDKIIELQKDTVLYRSQSGYDEIEEHSEEEGFFDIVMLPYRASRMIPDPQFVGNGRANAKGIPCLYLADNLDTAIAEIRPWLGERISVANFIIQKTLRILDLSNWNRKNGFYLKEPTDPKIIEREVWASVNKAFSKPVNAHDQDKDYIPTQVISEFFKRENFDGIKYKSLLSEGNNYAIFDLNAAIPTAGIVYEINSLNYSHEQFSNPADYATDGTDQRRYMKIVGFSPINKDSEKSIE